MIPIPVSVCPVDLMACEHPEIVGSEQTPHIMPPINKSIAGRQNREVFTQHCVRSEIITTSLPLRCPVSRASFSCAEN